METRHVSKTEKKSNCKTMVKKKRVEKMVIFVVKAHQTRLFAIKKRYANGVHLSAIWKNTALVPWIRCTLFIEYVLHFPILHDT